MLKPQVCSSIANCVFILFRSRYHKIEVQAEKNNQREEANEVWYYGKGNVVWKNPIATGASVFRHTRGNIKKYFLFL